MRHPEVLMLLALVLPAFSLSVPLRASFKEEIVPGETAVASSSTTATVTLWSPATKAKFTVTDDELTANKREASGKETLSFAESPAGSLRSWAIYYLDVDGNELGNPEIVEVSFDDLGNGTVAGRSSSSRLASLTVKYNTSIDTIGKDAVKVSVQDSGADAAYIGIMELTNSGSGSNLATNPDLTVMDAAIYAAFQDLTLDALVPLDTYTLQLEGTLNVAGLAVSTAGVVESGTELEWDLAFYDNQSCIPGSKEACKPLANETLSFLEPIGTVKKKSTAAPRVVLKQSDIVIDSTDASFSLTIQGDVRELEVSAAMDVYDHDKLVTGRDVVTLDPGGFGAKASEDDTGGPIVDIFVDVDTDIIDDDNVGVTPPWTAVAATLFEVIIEDEGGALAAEPLTCQMNPSAATLAGTARKAVLVGECTHGDDGVEVRRLRAVIGNDEVVHLSIEVGGPAFAPETTTTCQKGGTCTTTTTALLDGSVHLETQHGLKLRNRELHVTETDFDLPFQFDRDIDSMDAAMTLELYTPAPSIWTVVDGVVTAKAAGEVVASFDVEDVGLDATGDCKLSGFEVNTATVPKESSVGPVVLAKGTGPGKHKCKCSPSIW